MIDYFVIARSAVSQGRGGSAGSPRGVFRLLKVYLTLVRLVWIQSGAPPHQPTQARGPQFHRIFARGFCLL